MPTRIEENWTDTVLYQQGKKPVRGFGGKLMFYGDESDNPILVNGQLVVYAFDENGRAPTDNAPTRRYVFPADQLEQWLSVSELGASYSIWLPWDVAGGPQSEISLICRFEPAVGPVVVGKQSRQLLPGELSPSDIAADAKPKIPEGVPYKAAVEQAAYVAPAANAIPAAPIAASESNASTARRTMTSTTISLPESMRNFGPGATIQPGTDLAPTLRNARSADVNGSASSEVNGANQSAATSAGGYRLTAPSPSNTRYHTTMQRAAGGPRGLDKPAVPTPNVPHVQLHSNGHDVSAAMTRRPSRNGYGDQTPAAITAGSQSSDAAAQLSGYTPATTVW
jgi:hypothetical protein